MVSREIYYLGTMNNDFVFMISGDMSRIFDILLIMLLNPDTARTSIQKLHPFAHREYFQSRSINLTDQNSINSAYQQQDSTISNDTDDISVGDINEITFSVLIEDEAPEDGVDDGEDDEDTYEDDEAEQDESDDEKRVRYLQD